MSDKLTTEALDDLARGTLPTGMQIQSCETVHALIRLAVAGLAAEARIAELEAERETSLGLLAKFKRIVDEAKGIAALKYEVVHKGKGPPSDYDPDIYQLERVTSIGWWRFVHAVGYVFGEPGKDGG